MSSAVMTCLQQARLPGLLRRFAAAAVLASGLLPFAGIAAPIDNTATMTFQYTGNPAYVYNQSSNTNTVVALPLPSPSVVTFYQYAPAIPGFSYRVGEVLPIAFDGGAYDATGTGSYAALAAPTGWDPATRDYTTPINLAAPVPVRETSVYHSGDPIFITLTDANRNLDPGAREFITVRLISSTGDEEVLRMQETGANTGIFAAVIQSVGPGVAVSDNNGRLSVAVNSTLRVEYADDTYLAPVPVDTSNDVALVDPFGVVFDSRTGQPVDGARVTLIDLATGLPAAAVFDDDGVTPYPNSLISGPGNDAVDATHPTPPGGFRFPLIPPGNYRFDVVSPANYVVPSTVLPASMPNGPGGVPYTLVLGSYGEDFVVLPGPALEIDVPMDPLSTSLILQKNVSSSEASVGDFLQYQLILSNDDPASPATDTQVIDRLPDGFVYRAGSLRINGAPDPAESGIASADRRTLTIPLGDLAAGSTVKVTYVVSLSAGVRVGDAINTAQADANDGDLFSNVAQARVKVSDVLMTGRSTLIGRVYEGGCDVPFAELKGVPNVRVVMDDGTYTITDADGMYHFEAVRPGIHVVQMDVDSLPGSLEPQSCINNTRFAGRDFSQFVDVQAGSLWRADFHTRRRVDNVGIKMTSDLSVEETVYTPPPKKKVREAVFKEREVKNYTLRAEFDSCRDTLKPEGQEAVDDLLLDLKNEKIEKIEVTGNTDNQRLSVRCLKLYADNYVLSQARARRVGDALAAALNLKPEQVENIGKGPDNPVASNSTPDGMARNRRTELKVYLAPEEVKQDDEPEFEEEQKPIRTITVKGMTHRIEVDGSVPVKDLRVMAMIPEGYAYVPVSASVDGVGGIGASESGGALLFRLGDIDAPTWNHVIEFGTEPVKQDTQQTRVVEEHKTIRPDFDSCSPALKPDGELMVKRLIREFRNIDAERMEVQLHTDDQPLSKACAKKFDVYSLAKARAQTIADAMSSALSIPPERVVVRGIGPDAPMMSNTTAQGRQTNRRTEVYVEGKITELLKAEQLRPACETQPYIIKSVAMFESLHKKKQSSPAAENALACGEAAAKVIQQSAQAVLDEKTDKAAKAAAAAAKAAAPVVAPEVKAVDTPATDAASPAAPATAAPAAEVPATDASADAAVTDVVAAEGAAAGTVEPAAVVAREIATPIDPAHADSGRREVTVEGGLVKPLPPGVAERTKIRKGIVSEVDAAGGNEDWLAGQKAGREWLFPKPGHNPRGPAVRIVIKHKPRDTVALLRANGDPVSALNFEGTLKSADKSVVVSVWRAVPVSEGRNEFVAEITEAETGQVTKVPGTVVFAGAPVQAEFVPEQSVLLADGFNKPVVAVRLRDRDGNPVRNGMTGSVQISAPYMLAQQAEMLQKRQLAGVERFSPMYRVEGDDGIAYIELAPTTESGSANLNFSFQIGNDIARNQELRAWMEPAARDWIVVGFAEGTAGYNTLKDNIAALQADGMDDGGYTDGQVSLYAKGSIKGSWLLTMSYDTDKDTNDRRASVLSQIDPEKYFTIYGDGSTQRYDAPSQSKLYLKMERGQFYALFGDYETGLTQTKLSRYSRTLNGIKVEKGDGPVTFMAFASETPQRSAREDIQGNGTSGLYRLQRNGIVIGSERIRIETRDRVHADKIVQMKALSRHLDYDLDYDDGTLWFRQPVPSRDSDFNPIFIVVEYETVSDSSTDFNVGGRVATTLGKGGKTAVGVSAIRDDSQLGARTLEGLDTRIDLGKGSVVSAEVASSAGEQSNVSTQGEAWLLEYEYHGAKYDARVYTEKQESGFGLDQQSATQQGQFKAGAEGRMRLDQKWSLEGDMYTQENLATEATRDAVKAGARYEEENWSTGFGAQVIDDKGPSAAVVSQDTRSEQVTASVERWFMERKLQLSAEGDAGIGGKGSVDYPNRLTMGANYALTDSTRLLVGQEFTDGAQYDSSTTRVGVQTVPWKGARLDTTLNQSQMGEDGARTFAQYGLTQGVLISDKWGMDFSVDANETLSHSGDPSVQVNNPSFPVTNGGTASLPTLTEDYQAISMGATWRESVWSWNGRTEWRHSSSADKYGMVSNFLRQAKAGVAFASGFSLYKTDQLAGADGLIAMLDLSWAWRPLGSRWSLLDRLELKYDAVENGVGVTGGSLFGNTSLNTTGDAQSRRIVNNFALNRVSREWTGADRKGNLFSRYERNQWSLYYGSKYQIDTFDGVEYDGYTDLLGVEVRHDITSKVDIGFQASMLNQWSGGTRKYSYGPSIGWSPITNGWITVGYNERGYYDEDFDAARYTGQGVYLQVRVKFDQNTRIGRAKETAVPQVNPAVQAALQGQELTKQ
jgi:uncharacterized repeat protein (TIGR01451 family)